MRPASRSSRRSPLPVAVALAALLFVGPTISVRAQASERVTWEGRLEMGDATLLLEIEVSRPGEVTAWLTGVDGRRRPTAVEGFEIGPGRVAFRLPEIEHGYVFEGRLVSPARIEGDLERLPPEVPSTDLYRVTVVDVPDPITAPGWQFGTPQNLTDREGYDNQPRLLPDGRFLLYTSMRGEQTDIYRYDLESGAIRQLTDTPESEYSPTPLPGGGGFSTVRVELDGTQRLWAFDLEGSNPRLLLARIEPVGYHAWLDEETVALFVLGEPPTLQIADLATGESEIVARNIGRDLEPFRDRRRVLFVHKMAEGSWWFAHAGPGSDPEELESWSLETLPGREDFSWIEGSGQVLMGDGSKLFAAIEPGSSIASPAEFSPGSWHEIADFSSYGIGGMTRLALAPDLSELVFVAERSDLSSFPERLPLTLVLAEPAKSTPSGPTQR